MSTPNAAPAAVQARLLGAAEAVEALADLLDRLDSVTVVSRSGRRANRHDPGVRVYLTITIQSAR